MHIPCPLYKCRIQEYATPGYTMRRLLAARNLGDIRKGYSKSYTDMSQLRILVVICCNLVQTDQAH